MSNSIVVVQDDLFGSTFNCARKISTPRTTCTRSPCLKRLPWSCTAPTNTHRKESGRCTMKSTDSISGATEACRSGRAPSAADCDNLMMYCSPKPHPQLAVVDSRFAAAKPGATVAHTTLLMPVSASLACTKSTLCFSTTETRVYRNAYKVQDDARVRNDRA